MKQRARQGSGAPSHCWQCMKQLQRAPGRGLGLFYFELVLDKGGISLPADPQACADKTARITGKTPGHLRAKA